MSRRYYYRVDAMLMTTPAPSKPGSVTWLLRPDSPYFTKGPLTAPLQTAFILTKEREERATEKKQHEGIIEFFTSIFRDQVLVVSSLLLILTGSIGLYAAYTDKPSFARLYFYLILFYMAAHIISLSIKFALLNSFAQTFCAPYKVVSSLRSYDECISNYKHTVITITVIMIFSTLLICGVCAFVAHTFNKSQSEVYRTTHDAFEDVSYSEFTAPLVHINQSAVHVQTSQYPQHHSQLSMQYPSRQSAQPQYPHPQQPQNVQNVQQQPQYVQTPYGQVQPADSPSQHLAHTSYLQGQNVFEVKMVETHAPSREGVDLLDISLDKDLDLV
ncbi:hypothetical protein PROFUN_15984 [Planoprotostelium fungivorum]|uniref:Uncharacterized protein n=1 Tax=Planoprotostelium fungivorum TaxID=1890364 RepID=A0A2P6MTY6_9EUKA|nr:hypothetical protein PROFUN_15984 [Planoprotostelium fungivorum]